MEDGPSSAQRNPNSPSIEELADDYFSSVNSIARKFIIEKQEKKENLNTDWNNLNQNEKDKFINDWFIDEGIRLRYEIRMQGMRSAPTTESVFETYPKLKVPCGAKTVQYPESEQTNQVSQNVVLMFNSVFILEKNQSLLLTELLIISSQNTHSHENWKFAV